MKVVLGITGCIAAYKSAEILRLLQKKDVEVFPVMTRSAGNFIGPVTLEKLSGHKVIMGTFDDRDSSIEHISLARRTDLLLVAPATANSIAKFACGISDDFLSTLYISTATPVVLAPAMNKEMWRHQATRENIQRLKQRGVKIVQPESGHLACGEFGEGRLADPEMIVKVIESMLKPSGALSGLKVIVTAGPTIEDLDPVRYLSNRSSGRMGFAMASIARELGAAVQLISGPTHIEPPTGVEYIQVRSASQMHDRVLSSFEDADITVMAAAVSDFSPTQISSQKMKKETTLPVLSLRKTPDILKKLGKCKRQGQLLVGFAAETTDITDSARKKLFTKNLDLIVANNIAEPNQGFAAEFNKVICLDRLGNQYCSEHSPKPDVARFAWNQILRLKKISDPKSLSASS